MHDRIVRTPADRLSCLSMVCRRDDRRQQAVRRGTGGNAGRILTRRSVVMINRRRGVGKQRGAQGQKRAAKVKARQRRLAQGGALREQHAQLAFDRPDDPTFSDSDADSPAPSNPKRVGSVLDEMIEHAANTIAEPYQAAEDFDDEDGGLEDLLGLVTYGSEAVVASTIAQRSSEPARIFAERVRNSDNAVGDQTSDTADDEYGTPGLSMACAILVGWLTAAREEQADPQMTDKVLAWIGASLGSDVAQIAGTAADVLDTDTTRGRTVQYFTDELETDFLPALIWLTAGVVAEYGNGEVAWLHRGEGALLQTFGEAFPANGTPDEQPIPSTVATGQQWPSRADLWAALDTASAIQQLQANTWHGVFDRLLIHSITVATLGQVLEALITDETTSHRYVVDVISADLSGGRQRLKTMPAWQLTQLTCKFEVYFRWQTAATTFAVAAQAAINAYAAGVVPTSSAQLLPGENDVKNRAHHIDNPPTIPASIDHSPEKTPLLDHAENQLSNATHAAELADEMRRTGQHKQESEKYRKLRNLARDLAEGYEDFLADWATAVVYTLATTLRETCPRPLSTSSERL
jgi:hypothetical protein